MMARQKRDGTNLQIPLVNVIFLKMCYDCLGYDTEYDSIILLRKYFEFSSLLGVVQYQCLHCDFCYIGNDFYCFSSFVTAYKIC